MESDQYIWRDWARNLHRWGVEEWVASIMETAGPLNILAAQVVYLGQPFMKLLAPENQMNTLAEMLEDNDQRNSFINCIREADSGGS